MSPMAIVYMIDRSSRRDLNPIKKITVIYLCHQQILMKVTLLYFLMLDCVASSSFMLCSYHCPLSLSSC